jgi:hypothetical protein
MPTFIIDCPRCKAKVAADHRGQVTAHIMTMTPASRLDTESLLVNVRAARVLW